VTDHTTRAERMAQPTTRAAIRAVAEAHGACVRPIQIRRIDQHTGAEEQILMPCGATLTSLCPPCAERAKTLRATQCREGWHLEQEPIPDPPPPDDTQTFWIEQRAEAQAARDHAEQAGDDTAALDELIGDLDGELAGSGLRGKATPGTARSRRHRSTCRREDAPNLPKRPISPRTVGRTYTTHDGKVFRPSMFITLTCPSYGKVGEDGTPVAPASYDYRSAARDALHFAALFDRFIQNLRRCVGHDVQYFATIEPQRRLAPHVHIAIRGTISRAALRQVIAATYHQVWWPRTRKVRFAGGQLPVWHERAERYFDPGTGEFLPAWDESLDAIGVHSEPHHVARFGAKFDAQGVLAGSKDASRCIGYLTKYLTKHVGQCHEPETDAQHEHVDRLTEALRFEPAHPPARTGCGTASSPNTPGPGWFPASARAKPTGASTLATPGGGSWSHVNGLGRLSPTTAATAKPGSPRCSASRPTTRAATGGSWSPPPIPTTCPTPPGSCALSPTASSGKTPSPKPGDEPRNPPWVFRRTGGLPSVVASSACGSTVNGRGGGRADEHLGPVHPAPNR
jgi:hypothetical protein